MDVLRAIAASPDPIHVELPREPRPYQAALLRTLGATWSVRGAPQDARMETSAHDLAVTRVCGEHGCTGDASDAPRRGPLANKCEPHREAARQRMRERGSQGGKAKAAGGASPQPTAARASLVDATARLHKTAKALEERVARRVVARDAAKETLAEFNDALNAVKRTAEQLIAQ